MSVGWTCPSKRAEDPVSRELGARPMPCPGHKGECRMLNEPKSASAAQRVLARHEARKEQEK